MLRPQAEEANGAQRSADVPGARAAALRPSGVDSFPFQHVSRRHPEPPKPLES